MFVYRKRYFAVAGGLFLLEVYIALRVHDAFVRPYAGDFLATIWLVYLGRTCWTASVERVAWAALVVSGLIEGLQYVHFLRLMGWQQSALARIVLGSAFAWGDLLAYALGALAAVALARLEPRSWRHRHNPG